MDFIKNLEPIIICDIGASPFTETGFIDNLFNNTNSKIVGFEPNNLEFQKYYFCLIDFLRAFAQYYCFFSQHQ